MSNDVFLCNAVAGDRILVMSEGTITYDVRFYDYAPGTKKPIRLIINVESQLNYNAGYPLLKRAIFYGFHVIYLPLYNIVSQHTPKIHCIFPAR